MDSTLLQGGTVISFDHDTQQLKIVRDGSLLIKGDRIDNIYDQLTPEGLPDDVRKVDMTGKIISPGFIDTHRHGWQTMFKTLSPDSCLAEYFMRYNTGAAVSTKQLSAEDIYLGQLTGLYEALNAGVTTTVDHAHGHISLEAASAAINASIESKARVFYGYVFGRPMPGYAHADQLSHYSELAKSGRLHNTLCTLGVAYDEFTMAPEEEINAITSLVISQRAAFFTCHTLGGPWGFYNGPSLIDKAGLLRLSQLPCIFSHASWLTESDAALLRETNQ